jgi:WD40 repeat protein
LAFSPDAKTLASVEGCGDLSVELWAAATGELLGQCLGHEGRVYAVAFSPDEAAVASASSDKTLRLWQAANGQEIRRFKGDEGGIPCMAFSPDGKTLASGG